MDSEIEKVHTPRRPPIFVNLCADSIIELYKSLPVVPARITYYDMRRGPKSLECRINFDYQKDIDINYNQKHGFITVNSSAMDTFLNNFEVEKKEDLIGRDIYVYTRYIGSRDRIIVFGIIPLEKYIR